MNDRIRRPTDDASIAIKEQSRNGHGEDRVWSLARIQETLDRLSLDQHEIARWRATLEEARRRLSNGEDCRVVWARVEHELGV